MTLTVRNRTDSDRIIHIAFLQLLPGKTLEEQLEIGQKACREAKEKGADIALFPEMWSDGYVLPQDENELKSLAIRKDSTFVQAFRRLAREHRMISCVSMLKLCHSRINISFLAGKT